MISTTKRHHPSHACGGLHCHSCGVDEIVHGAFVVCYECGHVYRSASDLRWAYRWQIIRGGYGFSWRRRFYRALTVRMRDIRSCQHCMHDF